MRPWGRARWREVRGRVGSERRRPRRAICSLCRHTQVLIIEDCLARRRDSVEVIAAALVEKAGGAGRRSIARLLGRHESTVACWLRRFGEMAVRIREHFTAWAQVLDPCHEAIEPAGSPFADAVEAIGVVTRLAVRRFGPRAPFVLASVLTEGGLLATRAHPYRAVI